MLEKIKGSVRDDGYPEAWGDIIHGIFEDKNNIELSKALGRSGKNVERLTHKIYKHFKVKNRWQLIIKCEPYMRGERVCLK